MNEPKLITEAPSWLAVYKPPGIHSVPLKEGEGGTLLDWCAGLYPEVRSIQGRKKGEGGILHRLDYGTSGLVLFARTQEAFTQLSRAQEEGRFVKTYGALTCHSPPEEKNTALPGFPPAPSLPETFPAIVESAFRPWGKGRSAVRPVPILRAGDKRIYRTRILEFCPQGDHRYFRLEISRGFRHQIRCHLAWLGFPILGDALYGGNPLPGPALSLRAEEITFPDPLSGEACVCRAAGIGTTHR